MRTVDQLLQMIDLMDDRQIVEAATALIDKIVENVPDETDSMCFVRDTKCTMARTHLSAIELHARRRSYELNELQQSMRYR